LRVNGGQTVYPQIPQIAQTDERETANEELQMCVYRHRPVPGGLMCGAAGPRIGATISFWRNAARRTPRGRGRGSRLEGRGDMRAQVDVKEYRIPLLLLVVGFTILLIGSYLAHPALGFVLHLLVQVVQLAAAVAFGMAACYLVAKLWDTFFGDARSAIVKLAGIFTFTSAVSGLLGGFGFLVAWLLYLPLLMWLFSS
jgi:hypothetical protein